MKLLTFFTVGLILVGISAAQFEYTDSHVVMILTDENNECHYINGTVVWYTSGIWCIDQDDTNKRVYVFELDYPHWNILFDQGLANR